MFEKLIFFIIFFQLTLNDILRITVESNGAISFVFHIFKQIFQTQIV